MAKKLAISRLSVNDLVNLNPEDMAHLTKKQYKTLEKRLHKIAQQRLDTISKYGMTSYAAEKYFGGTLPELSKATDSRQKMQHNTVMLQQFLGAESSSYTGIRKIWKEEEKRIFKGRKGFTNEDERMRFWSAYDEFKRQNPALVAMKGDSSRLQQFLGRETFWRTRGFSASDLNNLVTKMMNQGGVDIRAYAGREPEI